MLEPSEIEFSGKTEAVRIFGLNLNQAVVLDFLCEIEKDRSITVKRNWIDIVREEVASSYNWIFCWTTKSRHKLFISSSNETGYMMAIGTDGSTKFYAKMIEVLIKAKANYKEENKIRLYMDYQYIRTDGSNSCIRRANEGDEWCSTLRNYDWPNQKKSNDMGYVLRIKKAYLHEMECLTLTGYFNVIRTRCDKSNIYFQLMPHVNLHQYDVFYVDDDISARVLNIINVSKHYPRLAISPKFYPMLFR